MSKMNSHCLLLLTLVFTSAHAPTFQFWRNPVRAEQAAADSAGWTGAPVAGASESIATLPREYAEEGDLKRFHLDELYLPGLDVSLPELFDWSDLDREYLADNGPPLDRIDFNPDNSRGASIRVASRAFPAAGGNPGPSSGIDSLDGSETTSPQTSKGDPSSDGSSDTAPGDTSNIDDTTIVDGGGGDPISDTSPVPPNPLTPIVPDPDSDPDSDPVPVPAPGAFGLFALGLAGLQLAGRKKKQKRLAAS